MAAQATLVPVADTEVRADIPTWNFGKATVMGLDGDPSRVAYLRFNVSVPAGEVVKKATLRLFMTSTHSASVLVRQVANTNWGETSTTYQNAPATGAQVASSGSLTANAYTSIDVTPLVTGSGPVSMAVTRSSTVPLGFSSREAASGKQPLLVVETEAGSAVLAGVGSLPIGSAQYAIPSNAVFVSRSGSDSGAGTLASPWKTIQRAINVAPTGRTIVVRAGTYHESLKIPSNRTFTIQAYPGEAVWLDGSTSVTGWVKSGSVWVKTGWTAAFDSTPGFNKGSPDYRFINSQYPMAAHPDQVWMETTRLEQVDAVSKVAAGTFHVDYATDRLTIGSDPTGRTVTASDLAVAINISGPNSKLLGIGVRKYATPSTENATVKVGATGVTLENVVVSYNASVGIIVARANARLNKVTSEYNGLMGINAHYAEGLVVTNVLAQRNNVERHNTSPAAGGMKIGTTRGITVRDSVFTKNTGTGLWIDESSYDAKVFNNIMTDNGPNGFSFEISSVATIADNVMTGNADSGIKINDATNIKVYNNTIGNNGRNIWIAQDARRASDLSIPGHDKRRALPDPTVTWLLGNVAFMNNKIGAATGQYNSYIRDYSGERSCNQMNIKLDGNQFDRQATGYFMVWGITATGVGVYANAAAFESATGQGPGNGDSAATTAPVALPADVAALIGQAVGTRHIGAFD